MEMSTRKGDRHFLSLARFLLSHQKHPVMEERERQKGERARRGSQPAGGTNSPLTFPIPVGLQSQSCSGALPQSLGPQDVGRLNPALLLGTLLVSEQCCEPFCGKPATIFHNELSKLRKCLQPTQEKISRLGA